jgi:myotubularin-related protein 14
MAAVNGSTATSTLIDDDCFTANDYFMRRERLTAVRTLFYNCYSSTIGYNFKNGADGALGSLLGNFAEKVGLTTQRTSV